MKLFTATYFLGLALFACALLIVLLALVGVTTVGKRIPLVYPIAGAAALMFGSKLGLRQALRKVGR